MLEDFDRFLVLINPASTGTRQITRRINEIRALIPERKLEIIEMPGRGRKANRLLLHNKASVLDSHTLLCIAAGDGTASLVVETLLQDKSLPSKARKTPILPLWGGNANDLANMLNGSASKTHLSAVFKQGQVIPIYPLTFDITHKDGSHQTRIAVCNASFGATANVAERLNDSKYRSSRLHQLPGGRLLKETTTAVEAMLKSQTFAAEESGSKMFIYERTISNGSRIAKHYRIPVKLNEKQFFLNTVEHNTIINALVVSASFRRHYSGQHLYNELDFIVREDARSQFDGETLRIPANSSISVRISKRPFYAVSTLLTE